MSPSFLAFTIILIFSKIINQVRATSTIHSSTLIKDQTQLPCSAISSTPSLLTGDEVFTQTNMISSVIFSMMGTHSLIIAGSSSTLHTIFSLHDISYATLFSISYNSLNKLFQIDVLDKTLIIPWDPNFPSLLNQKLFLKWNFDVSLNQPNVYFYYQVASHYYSIQQTLTPSTPIASLNSNNLRINIGYSLKGILLQEPACAYAYSLVLYLDPQPIVDSNYFPQHSKLAANTYLLFHYDFFYSFVNYRVLMSFTQEGYPIETLSINRARETIIYLFKLVSLPYINLIQEQGTLIYFEYKANTIGSLDVEIMRILSRSQKQIGLIYMDIAGNLCINADSVACISTLSLTTDQWYQIVVRIESVFQQTITLMVNNAGVVDSTSTTYTDLLPEILVQFGNLIFSGSIKIDNIRVFLGTFLSTSTTCLLETGRSNRECLFCQNGYMLSYQLGKICELSNISSTKIGILDWDRDDCPIGMMHYSLSTICGCPFSQYLDTTVNKCKKCPPYTNGCTETTQKMDINRQASGACKPGFFDDGYSCITEGFSLPLTNIHSQFDKMTYQSKTYQKDSLDLTNNDSFFIYLPIQYCLTNTNEEIVAYFQESSNMIFSITIKQTTSDPSVCFNFQNNSLISCVRIECTNFIKIGLQVSSSKSISFVDTHGFQTHEIHYVTSTYSDPALTMGYIDLSPYSKFSGEFPYHGYRIVKNFPDPTNIIGDVFGVMGFLAELIIHFDPIPQSANLYLTFPVTFSQTNYYPISYKESGVPYSFVIQRLTYDYFKGILIEQGYSGELTPNQTNGKTHLNIVFNYFIENLEDDLLLLSYETYTNKIAFYLLPSPILRLAYFKICMNSECKQSKYAFIRYEEPNQIAIITRTRNEFQSLDFIEYELVCNYKREKILFITQFVMPSNQIYFKQFRIYNNSKYSNYFNNMKIYIDDDFSFNYSASDGCYIYQDLRLMECVLTKPLYAFFYNKPVYKNDCSDPSNAIAVSQPPAPYFYKYWFSCKGNPSPNPNPHCSDNGVCTCDDPNADYDMNCSCKPGYFLSSSGTSCQPCGNLCIDCYGTADNCTSCKFENTSPPLCGCISSDYFMLSNYSCEKCSSQCETCEGDKDSCLTCSDDRVDAPVCNCDTRYYSTPTTISDECVPLVCSSKCKSCEYSSNNCTECAINRINTPSCGCSDNFYDFSGTCISCPSHYFLDSTQSCKVCLESCSQCQTFSYFCTECPENLFLIGNNCVCSDSEVQINDESGTLDCFKQMDCSLQAFIENDQYFIEITFDYELNEIDFRLFAIEKLVFIYFNQLKTQSYSIKQADIDGYSLKLEISFTENLETIEGKLIFLNKNIFLNYSEKRVLNTKYLSNYFTFSLKGQSSKSSEYEKNETIDNMYNYIAGVNPTVLSSLRQLSILLSVLNTLQPTVIFLMIDIYLPPNLNDFLELLGLFIFPNTKKETGYQPINSFFGVSLTQDIDYSKNESKISSRFNYCNNMILNIPIMLLQFYILILLFLGLRLWSCLNVLNFNNKIVNIITPILIKRIASTNEASLLVIIYSIFNQINYVSQEQFFSRISVFLSAPLLAMFIIFNCNVYSSLLRIETNLNFPEKRQKVLDETVFEQESQTAYLSLFNKLDFQKRPKITRYFYFFQIFKKYLIAISLVFSETFPLEICVLGVVLLTASLILSISYHPYTNKFSNITRIIGDLCQLTVWVIYTFIFLPFQYLTSDTISDEDMSFYLYYGSACIYALIIFSALYFLEFCLLTICLPLYNLMNRKIEDKKDQIKIRDNNYIGPQGIRFSFIQNPYISRKKQTLSNNT